MSISTNPLITHLDDLATLEDLLASPPHRSDPMLWAAHEVLLCARTLLTSHVCADHPGCSEHGDIEAAIAQLRSAGAAVRFAATDPQASRGGQPPTTPTRIEDVC